MMPVRRAALRIGLVFAGFGAILVAAYSVWQAGARRPEAWATVSAAFAVVTAVVSAWTSQRFLQLQEDAIEPTISVTLDARRRPRLVQLRVANLGGSVATDLEVRWEQPLLKVDGTPVRLTANPLNQPDVIPILPPGESTAVLVGAGHVFFQTYRDTTYKGIVIYRNASGIRKKRRFVASAELHRVSLVHEDEDAISHEKIQELPQKLTEISEAITLLGTILRDAMRGDGHRHI